MWHMFWLYMGYHMLFYIMVLLLLVMIGSYMKQNTCDYTNSYLYIYEDKYFKAHLNKEICPTC